MATLVGTCGPAEFYTARNDVLLAAAKVVPQRSVWGLRKQRSASTGIALMSEMSHSGEDHGDAMFVAGGDHFVIIL
jgi:hypothetical protein